MDGKVEEDPMTKALDLAVCMAHPDDECLAAGALMAQSAHESLRVGVFLATAGESSEHPSLRGDALGDLRLSESAKALALLDVPSPFSPRLPDGELMNHRNALSLALDAWLIEMRPKKVITYGLDGGYGHPDHIAVTQTLVDLNRYQAFELWQTVFPEGVFDELREFLGRVHPKLLSEAAAHRVVEPELVLNSSELFKLKRSALELFETQLHGRRVESFLGKKAMRHILREEHFAPMAIQDVGREC